ncbi:MAG: BatD family protein [Porphyromonas sp.]|nr:BatD family protein [Porphyromonas sp.]
MNRYYTRVLQWGLTIVLLMISATQVIAQNGTSGKNLKLSVDIESGPRVGEPFKVSFTIDAKARGIKLGSLDPSLKIILGPSIATGERQVIMNGKRESASFSSFSYMIMAEKEGTFKIPSASVKVGSATYSSPTQTFKVFPASTKKGSEATKGDDSSRQIDLNKGVFFKLILSKTTMYEQEGFLASFKIYSLYDFRFNDVKFPEFDGFLSQSIENDEQIQLTPEQYNGRLYLTGIIKRFFLTPQRSGELTIPSGKFDLTVSVPVQKSQESVDAIFGNYLGSYQNVQKIFSSQPMRIKVKPLPTPVPEKFNGAIGRFSMTASAPSSVVKSGESYKIVVKVSGDGNLKLIDMPKPIFPTDFDVYDPQEEQEISISENGSSGTREISYFAVPRSQGDYTIPPIQLIYFDPKSGKYETLSSKPFKLHVDKGDGAQVAAVSNFSQNEEASVLSTDIHYIKNLSSNGHILPPRNRTGYLLSYLAITILTTIIFFILRSKNNERMDNVAYRSKKAGSIARKWLKQAEESLKRGNSEEYYETLLKGMVDYLGSKLNIPMSEWSKEALVERLASIGASEDLQAESINLLSQLEFNRYTQNQSISQREELYRQSAALIGQIEEIKKK